MSLLIDQYLNDLQENQTELNELIIPISTDPSHPFFWLMIGTLVYIIIKAIKQARQESEYRMSLKCDKLHGRSRDLCAAKARETLYKKLMAIAHEGKMKCYMTKDISKCKDKVDEIYNRLEKRYKDVLSRIKHLK
jgi:hypothetical protein